jgi:signal transduction histidine kinase
MKTEPDQATVQGPHPPQQPPGAVFEPPPNVVIAHRGQAQQDVARERADLAEALQRALETQRITQEALEGRSQRQATIVRLGLEALASRDLNGTLDLLVGETTVALGADFCCVLELGADRTTFIQRAAFGGPSGILEAHIRLGLGDSQADYTLHATAPVVCPDLRTETRFPVQPLLLQHGAVSGMSAILHGKQQAWGVVGVHTKTLRTFSEDDINFLQAVANLMALAIERDRVETALRHRNRQQAAVALLGKRALLGPHMDEFFGEAVRDVAGTLEVEICELLQRDPDGRTLLLRAGVGWQPGLVGSARVSAGMNSQAGFTLNSLGPVVVTDLRTETRFDGSTILRDHGVVSGMSVLVPGRNRPFGVLGAHARSPRSFTQDDINFLHAVANLLAAAIERHGVEKELRRHRDNLEGLVEERTALLAASNRELEAFSYTISHDLRAPLRSINGLGKILEHKHGDSLPAAAKEMLHLMTDETVRMGNLIESILSLSRLGTVKLTHISFDVSAAAISILQALQAGDPARTVGWTVEPGLRAVGDEALLRLLLENLLGNAWKFTGRTPDARITVGLEVGGFRVEDNGAGFDMAHARELFQPFHRLHEADEFEGTGIGLATVSRIVGRHGGRVWAQGVPGQGATFRVTLPQDAPPTNGHEAATVRAHGIGAYLPASGSV